MDHSIMVIGGLAVYAILLYAAYRTDFPDGKSLQFSNLRFTRGEGPDTWDISVKPFGTREDTVSVAIHIYRNGQCIARAPAALTADVYVLAGPYAPSCVPTTKLTSRIRLPFSPYSPPPGLYTVRVTEQISERGARYTDWRKEILNASSAM